MASSSKLRAKSRVSTSLFDPRQTPGLWFIIPAAIALLVVVAYPLLYGFYISLFNTNLLNRWDFVGFKYYLRIFTSSDFLGTVFTTLVFTVGTVAGQFVIGLGLALLLNTRVPGRAFFRTVLIVPWLFPEVVVALLWKWMFNPLYGLFNDFLLKLNLISEPVSWLGSTSTAMPAVILRQSGRVTPWSCCSCLQGFRPYLRNNTNRLKLMELTGDRVSFISPYPVYARLL